MESIKKYNRILKFPPNTVETLRKKYNLDNGRMEQSLDLLQEWIKKQRHFTCHDFDREYLETTIICCKGSLEKAKRQTDRICTLRTLVPNFFLSEDIGNKLRGLFDIGWFVLLPKQTKDYRRVMLAKISDKEFTAEHIVDYYKLLIIMGEYCKLHDYPDGFLAIIDYRDVNLLEVMKKLNPVEVQQMLTVLIEGYGASIKGVHLISQSKLVELLIKTVKPFLSQKIADRIHVNQEIEELYSIIGRDLLPIEYGGNERSLHELNEMWYNEISSPKFEAYLAKMKAMCTNESLRLTEKFNTDCAGLPGSFRTLSVD